MAEKKRSLLSKDIFGEKIVELAGKNENIVVCDADLMRCFGTKKFSQTFPDRHFNFGIAEQNMTAAAGGMALCGKSVFTSTFANFATKRACDQVSISVCYNQANVKVCGLYAGLTGEKNGGTHIGIEDVALMRSFPGMTVAEPADTYELEAMTEFFADFEGPVYFRMPKMYLRQVYSEVPVFRLGKADILKKGNDVTVIACGITTGIAMDAAEALEQEGISVRVINMSSIKPLDQEAVLDAAEQTKAIVTIENHSTVGGLGSAAADVLAENGSSVKLYKIGIPDRFGVTASLDYQLKMNGITAGNLIQTVKSALA